jgi:N-acetyl-D-muramate 6-phosphate phosphatase
MIQALLFDLDGTFADTAPDLTHTLNLMRTARDLAPIPLEFTRPVTSTGARGMLAVGFSLTPEHPRYPSMRQEFLDLYARNLCRDTTVFPGIPELLEHARIRGLAWGIVTNKAERLARPLIDALRVAERCGCIIGGDPGATWFRRGLRSRAVHTEDQSPRKSTGKAINANDERYALAA